MICKKVYRCCEDHQKSKHTFSDRKGGSSKLFVENKNHNRFKIVDFENCVYDNKQNETKCDYGLITEECVFYIELKGSEISKGIKQSVNF